MTDCRLGEAERRGEVTDGRLALRSGLNQTEQSQPSRVGNGLQHSREPFGIGTLDRLAGKRRDSRSSGLRGSHDMHLCTNSINRVAEPSTRLEVMAGDETVELVESGPVASVRSPAYALSSGAGKVRLVRPGRDDSEPESEP